MAVYPPFSYRPSAAEYFDGCTIAYQTRTQNLGQRDLHAVLSMLPHMGWDGLTLKALVGSPQVVISGVLLLAGVGPAVPMIGFVAGVGVTRRASAHTASRPRPRTASVRCKSMP